MESYRPGCQCGWASRAIVLVPDLLGQVKEDSNTELVIEAQVVRVFGILHSTQTSSLACLLSFGKKEP